MKNRGLRDCPLAKSMQAGKVIVPSVAQDMKVPPD